jgi:hypothetical protein
VSKRDQDTTEVNVIASGETSVKKPPAMVPAPPQTTRKLLVAEIGLDVEVTNVVAALPTAPPVKIAVAPALAVTVAVVPASVPLKVNDFTMNVDPAGRVMLIVAVPPNVRVSVNDTMIAGDEEAAMIHLKDVRSA